MLAGIVVETPHMRGFNGEGRLRLTDEVRWTDVAKMRGLIETEVEYDQVLIDATLTQSPGHLRDLFVQLLVHCKPASPQTLCEKQCDALAEDCIHHAPTTAHGVDAGLRSFDLLLHSHGTTAEKEGLPRPAKFNP